MTIIGSAETSAPSRSHEISASALRMVISSRVSSDSQRASARS